MAEITVRAETAVLGMRHGDEQTVEDTPFIRKVISGGRLSLVESTSADTAASTPPPDVPGVVAAAPAGEADQLDDPPAEVALYVGVDPGRDVDDAAVYVRPGGPDGFEAA